MSGFPEDGFDLLEMKNGSGALEQRMKTGQKMTLEAWGRLDGCRAFAVDENGTREYTDIVEYDDGPGEPYTSSLSDLRDVLVGVQD